VTSKQWAKDNPERQSAFDRASKAVRRSAVGRFTADDVLMLLAGQNYQCAATHCRADVSGGFHCDHIVPVSRGGTSWPDNIQILCPSCNLSKHAMTMEEWQTVLTTRRLLSHTSNLSSEGVA
jgi:5-methylcytosine-specific restriction endonuclease McrA